MSVSKDHSPLYQRQQLLPLRKGTELGGLPGEGSGLCADFTQQLAKLCGSAAQSHLLQYPLHFLLLLGQVLSDWSELGGLGGLGWVGTPQELSRISWATLRNDLLSPISVAEHRSV